MKTAQAQRKSIPVFEQIPNHFTNVCGKSIASYQPRQTEPRAPELSTSQQRSIKPNSSAKNNLLDSWNSNTAASISAAGLLDSWGQDQIPRLEQPLQSLLLANGINQSTAAADTGALDD
eukprot:g41293.t1